MIIQSMNYDFGNIHSRLKYNSEKGFDKPFFNVGKYSLLTIDKKDIFFTSPSLFLWIDTGLQELTNASTNEKYIKLIHSDIFEIAKRDFLNITDSYTDILCLIDLNFNPNKSSKLEFQNKIKELELYKENAKTFFTAEHWEKNTFLQ